MLHSYITRHYSFPESMSLLVATTFILIFIEKVLEKMFVCFTFLSLHTVFPLSHQFTPFRLLSHQLTEPILDMAIN